MKFKKKIRNDKKIILNYINTCIITIFIALTLFINNIDNNKSSKEIKPFHNAVIILEKSKPEISTSNPIPEPEVDPIPPEIIESETNPETSLEPAPIIPSPTPEPIIPDANTNIATYVQSLRVTGIGDSIMLGAVPSLYAIFPNGYFDAAISRQIIHAYDIINSLNYNGLLGDPIIINLGANSFYNNDYKRAVISMLEGKEVFWLTVTNNHMVGINDSLRTLGNEIPNLHIIDWEAISAGHPEYFGADGIHLTGTGQTAYVNAIYSALCTFCIQKYPELNK